MQIPQVVMNIDYKLEPIAVKNAAAYFHDFDFNSIRKTIVSLQKYPFHSKSLHFKSLLRQQYVRLKTFVKTDSRGRHINFDQSFLIILLIDFCRFLNIPVLRPDNQSL